MKDQKQKSIKKNDELEVEIIRYGANGVVIFNICQILSKTK